MSAFAIESGTLLQLALAGAGAAVAWGKLQEAITEMRTGSANLREAVAELRGHRERDQARLAKLEQDGATMRVEMRQIRQAVAELRDSGSPDSDPTPTEGHGHG